MIEAQSVREKLERQLQEVSLENAKLLATVNAGKGKRKGGCRGCGSPPPRRQRMLAAAPAPPEAHNPAYYSICIEH